MSLINPRLELCSASSLDRPEVRTAITALLDDLVAAGAALGWVDPPGPDGVGAMLDQLAAGIKRGDAAVLTAWDEDRLVGYADWRRYERATHRPHADINHVAVSRSAQGSGVGGLLVESLIASARRANIEMLTLDFRGDNAGAERLYRRHGFREYGRLPAFVAVGERRWDKVFHCLDLR